MTHELFYVEIVGTEGIQLSKFKLCNEALVVSVVNLPSNEELRCDI
jgi:hypothetical protein